ncbi:RrF2 family transcriptional regulator [Chengkuizengella axinellae]|uniref:Rrf2 family transcriptional regulator n=1 Tax=Chengkuizengella axinellae TaxID=3064388 RepID=A0ABT9J4C3_9BACL|nr:Rrf2 family transcriptional regulator [Chengkuizengella sp. 2205SS18-9]MDP5276481.1 Rrf2 family transcriptional regulator [Chengkuizengella sp. 2205SS18-9]
MNSEFTLAVHSLTYLSLLPEKMSTSDCLAESASVHPVRIRKVLSMLKKNGYIASKEGAGGGFMLKKNPHEISIKDIYTMTSQGTLKPKCKNINEHCIVGANMQIALNDIFSEAEKHFSEFLGQYTIEDVINKVKAP